MTTKEYLEIHAKTMDSLENQVEYLLGYSEGLAAKTTLLLEKIKELEKKIDKLEDLVQI